MEIWEVIRRWCDKQTISEISKVLGYDRKTIRGYIKQAQEKGISRDSPLPDREQFAQILGAPDPATGRVSRGRAAQAQALLHPFLQEIIGLVTDKENPVKPKSAFNIISSRHNLAGAVSYTSFKRFVREHQIAINPKQSTCRIEVAPGSEVQIDYATMGYTHDPHTQRRRRLSAFIGTLSYSRHKFVELVYTQNQQSFVGSHVRMFDYFGCVPERINLDNLKTGVIKPDLYDPVLNRSYQELAVHYGCFLDPCRVRHPKDKGKVERDVQTIRQAVRSLIHLHPEADIKQLNALIRHWCIEEYGQRKHGTTHEKPYPVFLEKELPAGKPLPSEPFEVALWKDAIVHPDHYIQVNKKTYALPTAYIGKEVLARVTQRMLYVYYKDVLIKQYLITEATRHTDISVFPTNVQAVLDTGLHKAILTQAQGIGPHFHRLILSMLKDAAFSNLRKVQGLLALGKTCDHALMDKASVFAVTHTIRISPKRFKALLVSLQEQLNPTSAITMSQETLAFVRDLSYFTSSQEPEG